MSVDVSTATREDVLAAQAIVDMLAGTGVVVEESVKALAELDPMEVAPRADVADSAEASARWSPSGLFHLRDRGQAERSAAERVRLLGLMRGGSVTEMVAEVAETNRQAAVSYHRAVEGVFAGDGSMAGSFVAGLTPADKALLRASLEESGQD